MTARHRRFATSPQFLDRPAQLVLLGCAELAFLAALTATMRWLMPPAAARAWPGWSAPACAIVLAAAGSLAYLGWMKAAGALAGRRLVRRPGERGGEAAAARFGFPARFLLERLTRALLAAGAVLACYGLLGGVWWPVAAIAAGTAGSLLAAAALGQGPAEAEQDDSAPPAWSDRIEDLKTFARSQTGLNVRVVVDAGGPVGESGARCDSTAGGARITLTPGMMKLLSEAELKAVVAHEAAHLRLHHAHRAIIAWTVAQAAAVAGACGAVGAAAPAAANAAQLVALAPLAALTWYLTHVLVGPAVRAVERLGERRAFRLAVEMTGDPASLVAAMRKIAARSGYREPPRWQKWLLYDQASLGDVLRIARRFGLGAPGAPRTAGKIKE